MLGNRTAIIMWGTKASTGGGGAERRFARAFCHLRKNGSSDGLFLLVNEGLLDSLVQAEILGADISNIVVWEEKSIPKLLRSLVFACWCILWLRRVRANIVHLPLIQRGLLPLYLYLLLDRRPRVVSTVAFSHFGAGRRVPWATMLTARVMWSRSQVVDALYERFKEKWAPVLGDKIRVTPFSFTDPKQYYLATTKENTVCFAGRLIPEKNPLLFVEAIRTLVGEHLEEVKGWKFGIYGKGPLGNFIAKRISDYGLEDFVTLDSRANLALVLRKSSIFVSIQETENYPSQSMLEAMACGNAVVATDVGETRKLISDTTGRLMADAHPHSLAKELLRLMENCSERQRLGSEAAKLIRQKHTVEEFAGYLLSLWHQEVSLPVLEGASTNP